MSRKQINLLKALNDILIVAALIMCFGTITVFAAEPKFSIVKTSEGEISFGEKFQLTIVNSGDEYEIVDTEWSVKGEPSFGPDDIKILSSDKKTATVIPMENSCWERVCAKISYNNTDLTASSSNALATATVYFLVKVEKNTEDIFYYRLNDDLKSVCITSYSKLDQTEIEIPQELQGYKVTKIGLDYWGYEWDYEGNIYFLPDNIEELNVSGNNLYLANPNTKTEASLIAKGLVYADYNGNVSMQCGKNAYWHLNIYSGEMKLTGSGRIDDYDYATKYRKYMKNVTIENGIVNIPDDAFGANYSHGPGGNLHLDYESVLENVTIPESVIEIGSDAFSYCGKLKNITLPSKLKTIGSYAFVGCTGISEIVIPGKVEKIGYRTFKDCIGLNNITIPDSVTTIGSRAFSDCTKLESVKLSKNLLDISSALFENCGSLKEIFVPNNCKSIAGKAFSNCTNLKKVTIGSNVTSISETAFDNAYNVTIYGYKNSTAETYADTYKIPFVSLGNASSGSSSGGSSSSGGGGGSSSGGGGGSSSGGGSGTKTQTFASSALPSYVVKGTWNIDADGKWTFADQSGNIYKNKWGAIYNPYANVNAGQDTFDWFYFDENGNMLTGWFLDNGLWYYLNPASDGTQGKMVTGWKEINGLWYYFNPVSDGTRGCMKTNTWIDQHHVNADGVWDSSK